MPIVAVLACISVSLWILASVPLSLTGEVVLTLGGLPLVSFLILIGVRLSSGDLGRRGDLVLNWFLIFLLGAHVLVILSVTKRLPEMDSLAVMSGAAGLLFVGLGPFMSGLEFENAMGIRIEATMADEAHWRSTHRFTGAGFVLSGVATIAMAFFVPLAAAGLVVLGPALVLGGAVMHARSLSEAEKKDEEGPETPRPSENSRAKPAESDAVAGDEPGDS